MNEQGGEIGVIHCTCRALWKIALVFVLVFTALSAGLGTTRSAHAEEWYEKYLGEIQLFPYGFVPKGWEFAAGQKMSIQDNQALYTVLGTTYGGNGQSDFALPDLTSLPIPDGMGYYIATDGVYPRGSAPGYAGEVRIFPYSYVPDGWLKLDGRTYNTQNYPQLYSVIGSQYGSQDGQSFTLPSFSALLPNTPLYFAVSTVSFGNQNGTDIGSLNSNVLVGQTIPFLVPMQTNWSASDGRTLRLQNYQALFALVGWKFGGDGRSTFAIPDLRNNSYNFQYYTVDTGIYPTRGDRGGGPSAVAGTNTIYTVATGKTVRVNSSDMMGNVPDSANAKGVSLRTQPQYGTVTQDSNGFIYQAPNGYFGNDSFTVRTYNDNGFATGYSTVQIKIEQPVPPVVTGVSDGGIYNRTVNPVFTSGTAILNGSPFASGSPVTAEGNYTLLAANRYGMTQVQFTIDLTPPTVSGVTNGGRYTVPPTITFSDGTATLNGTAFANGGQVSQEGSYTLIVTDAANNSSTIVFSYYAPRQLTFDSDGGASVATQPLYYGDHGVEPTAPTRTGYTFIGWYSDVARTQSFNFENTAITTDTQLYAGWRLNQYTVSFDSSGGTAIANIPVNHGLTISEPTAPTRTGYTFNGWFTDVGRIHLFRFENTAITQNTQLYAEWFLNHYTVSFNSSGGTAVADVPVNHGSTLSAPTAPTRTGYTFTGWFSDPSRTQLFNFSSTEITGNTQLYAGWSINQYTVSFNSVGGTAVSDVPVTYGSTISAPTAPTRTGYTFTSWYSDAEQTQLFNFANTPITTNTQLYAGWNINQYSVSFDSNGGTAVADRQIDYGTLLSEPTAPTLTGYTFGGWYTDAAHTQRFEFASMPITVDTQLYASWTLQSYTVTFDVYQGDHANVPDQTITYGALITRPTDPVRTGYTFTNWYADAAHTLPFDFQTIITDSVTLYAGWSTNQYVASFESNGGTLVSEQLLDYGDPVQEPQQPSRLGYTFTGWYIDAGLEQRFDFATSSIQDHVQLYAGWERILYTVSFDTTGGSDITDMRVGHGDQLTLINEPTSDTEGQVFAGWFADSQLTVKFDFSQPIQSDVTLYAKWAVQVQQITFDTDEGTTIAPQTVAYGDLLSRPTDPERTGYTFAGWFTDSGQPFDFATTTVVADMTLYAKWNIAVRTVTFQTDGGTTIQAIEINNGEMLSRPSDPVRTGYTFTGWYSDIARSQPFDFATATINADMTLYAGWTLIPPPGGGNSGNNGNTGNSGGSGDSGSNESGGGSNSNSSPISSGNPSNNSSSTQATVSIPAGQAGELRLGTGVLLEVPAGASDQPLEIKATVVDTPVTGLASNERVVSQVVEFTKNTQGNFKIPVKLTLTFDPTSVLSNEKLAVFYQQQPNTPWTMVEDGKVDGNNISVDVNHFTRFAVMAVPATIAVPTEANFSDIEGHWASASIREAAALGIVNGYSDGSFRPGTHVTRAEFTAMLVRMLKPVSEQENTISTMPSFTDEAQIGAWAHDAIAQASALGWIQGHADGNFRPNVSITRAEMAVMVSRALTLTDVAAESSFTDAASIPAWASQAAAHMQQSGLMKGRVNGAFDSSALTTRAEAAQVLMNALRHK
ncbi:InlB B-repeat-containing protein [Paenibacillus sp. MER 99-2]|uniref:InlB B-repeat-containing protein n=1 Tax=Paenibacillus sp. MER 99-2 TaxID=2939572 RepID=UPI00203FDC4F|nr:InlB B-repeat-containing protein [Paenibacillus sp. MER 99-2]MCM3174874.1 InlB B-repeat-containing protein [Paenibacillus sp. MER 99-2]